MRAPEDDVRESGRGLGDGRRRPGRRAAGLTSGPDQRTRPGGAVAASCLGFVAAAFAAFFAAVELLLWLFGEGDLWRPAVALACLAGLVVGGCLLLLGRGRRLLILAGLVWTALLTAVSVTEPELRMDGAAGVLSFLLPALAPPVLSAVLAARPAVRDWLAVAPS